MGAEVALPVSYWGESLPEFRRRLEAAGFQDDGPIHGARLSTWAWAGLAPFETDGWAVAEWISANCCYTDGPHAREPIQLRNWQVAELLELFRLVPGTRRRLYRRGLLGIGRKNGKSTLGAGLALQGLCGDGEWRPQVYSAAGTRDQARIVYKEAVAMVRLSPELDRRLDIRESTSEIRDPESTGWYRALSAEAYSSEGLNVYRCVFDEVHVQPDHKLWDVMTLAGATREHPLTLGITTAGFNKATLCGRMYDAGRATEAKIASGELEHGRSYFKWFEAPRKDAAGEEIDWRDIESARLGNPGMGTAEHPDFLLGVAVLEEQEGGENAYRRYRRNQWTTAMNAWLPDGVWDAAAEPNKVVAAGADVCLGLDGSYNNDSTAVIACDNTGFLFVVDMWEKPEDDDEWTVPIEKVEQAIREACVKFEVNEVLYDPYRWERTAQVLRDGEGIKMIEFPQSTERLTQATTEVWDGLTRDKTLHHDGDPRLARHVANARILSTPRGDRIVKETKDSPLKIDAAVAAVMAYSRYKALPQGMWNIW